MRWRAARLCGLGMRKLLERVAKETLQEAGVDVPYLFGTMIELPRASM